MKEWPSIKGDPEIYPTRHILLVLVAAALVAALLGSTLLLFVFVLGLTQ